MRSWGELKHLFFKTNNGDNRLCSRERSYLARTNVGYL